jgi:hypothetical protein
MLRGSRRSVDATARHLRRLYDALAAAPDLRPAPAMDATFRALGATGRRDPGADGRRMADGAVVAPLGVPSGLG